MGSNTPSPANVCSSITLKLPPSSVSPLELVSHSARAGRGAPERSFQMDNFSAPMGEFTIGTSPAFLEIIYPFELADEAVLKNITSSVMHCRRDYAGERLDMATIA